MKKNIHIYLLLLSFGVFSQSKYHEDFDYFWSTIDREYAYFDAKQTDWAKVKTAYKKVIDSVKTDAEFIYAIELMKHELYDPHFGLNKNLPYSFRLIPNDLDAYISIKNGKYIITDIRTDYKIKNSEIFIGDELLTVNGKNIDELVTLNLPASIKNPNNEVKEYFANLIFAGRHNEPRNFEILHFDKQISVSLDKPALIKESDKLLEYFVIQKNFGYIKINNSLGNNDVIKAFPKAVDALKDTKGLIIDLRTTQNGGNAEVAKAIMGKFIKEPTPYQIHETVGLEREFGIKRRYIELLFPLEKPYLKPVYILVSRWTGSIGEAIAQGFSNMKNATVIGTPMAKLLGSINCQKTPNTELGFCYPFEKLFNIDGTPRENFKVDIETKNFEDTFYKMLELLNE